VRLFREERRKPSVVSLRTAMKPSNEPVTPVSVPNPIQAGLSAPPAERPAWATHGLDQRIIASFVADDTQLFHELSDRGVNEESVRAHARAIGITHEFIKECRLSGSRPAMRVCIKCDARFLSSGIHNRLCRRCCPR
jgi:hypothetical protein